MRARTSFGLLAGLLALLAVLSLPAAAMAKFGLERASVSALDRENNPQTQAGSHPYKFIVYLRLNTNKEDIVEGKLRDLNVELPPGLVGNPLAVPVCSAAEFASATPRCPPDSQIGIARVEFGGFINLYLPLYNREASTGYAGALGFSLFGENSIQEVSVRTGVDYGLTVSDFTIPSELSASGIKETIWGVPADPGHDAMRSEEALNRAVRHPATVSPRPYLTLPPSCSGPLNARISVDSIEDPNNFDTRSVQISPGLDGCNKLEFNPTLKLQPTTNLSDSPTGLDVAIHQPQARQAEPQRGGFEFCSPGNWAAEPTRYRYQWLRNGEPIAGATSSRYDLQPADTGTELQCQVVAENEIGRAVAASVPQILPVEPGVEEYYRFDGPPRLRTNLPLVAKSKEVSGENTIFTCESGGYFFGKNVTTSYQWYSNGEPIAGETNQTYTVETAKLPPNVQCRQEGSNPQGAGVFFSAHRGGEEIPPEPGSPDVQDPPEISETLEESPLAPANLRDVTVVLPEGLVLNPSASNGLGSCEEQQVGYEPKEGRIRFSEARQQCPDSAKLGTAEISSPLVDHPLLGSVYLAKPYQNPFGTLLALYLTVEDPRTGTFAALAGRVDADPSTGQLTVTFSENPDLPLEDIGLHFFNGRRAALTTPIACGSHTTTSDFVPWSTPEGIDAHPSDSFQTIVAASGSGACPSSEATAPNAPTFSAGTVAPLAGSFSPFLLRLVRANGTQRLRSISAALPTGLLGRLAGVPYCSEAGIALARSREAPQGGSVEVASPSCPAASEIGSVIVGAGSGISPFYVTGHVYLAGPYRRAPLSLVVITPAIAGPFDLGAVVTRIALSVDPVTTQISAVSDPLPAILQGVPLDIRSVEVKLDRSGFSLNPTSCEKKQITAMAVAVTGQAAQLANSFQVGECKALGFKPKLALRFSGAPPRRGGHPKLQATLTTRAGDANIGSAVVTLPKTEFLENAHIRTVCTRVQYAANSCPEKSRYGFAKAWSPLLDQPLEGPVFLRSSSNKLPDLVASLDGQIHVDLDGRVESVKARIRNSFEALPDAPISKFELTMQGGDKGLLVNNTRLCTKRPRAEVQFTGQNGKVDAEEPVVKVQGCGHKKKKKKKK